MIRATAATWLNYATTLAFQILFAANFGSSGEAGAFVIAFAVAVSLGGVLVSTVLTTVLPRMLDKDGAIARPAVRTLIVFAGLTILAALTLAASSPSLGAAIAPLVAIRADVMATLIFTAALFLATVGLSGIFTSIALVRGRRFLPVLAPALPSTLGLVYLLGSTAPTVTGALQAIVAGGVIQLVLVGSVALWPRPNVVDGPALRIGGIAMWSALLVFLIGLLPALQRILAATNDPAGAAQFDYAARGIQVAQQLLIGGLLVALLPAWTSKHAQEIDIRPEVARTAVAATLLLVAAGSIALVAAPLIVELIYQRGAFVSDDTDAVVFLTRVLIPGFVAEGLWLVIAQAMLATGRNDIVLRVWFVRFATQLLLTIILGLPWGAVGVAAAYSVTMLIATGYAAAFSAGLRTLQRGSPLLLRSVQAGLITAAVAVALMLADDWIPPWLAAVTVALVAVGSSYRWQLIETVFATLSGRDIGEQGSGA